MLIHKDLPYSEQKTDVRLLDWFAPEGDCRATMVWMHGGGIEGGDRRGFRWDCQPTLRGGHRVCFGGI